MHSEITNVVLVTAPAEEPVSLAEARLQARIDHTEEDALVSGWITAAREYVEEITGRAFITSTWNLFLDCFPCGPYIKIPKGKLQSVASITYTTADGDEVVVDPASYYVDATRDPGLVSLNYGLTWPTVTLRPTSGIAVRFTAGYGDAADVPSQAKSAIMLLVSHYYRNREAVTLGTTMESKPLVLGVDALLSNLRLW